MYGMGEIGMFDMGSQVGKGEFSWNSAMEKILGPGSESLEQRTLSKLKGRHIQNAAKVVDCMKWLGCFSEDVRYESQHPSTMDSFCAVIILPQRLSFFLVGLHG